MSKRTEVPTPLRTVVATAATRTFADVASFAVAVVLAAILAACGNAPSDDGTLLEVDAWQAHVELRIGSLDDAEQSLTRVDGVVIGPDGRLYIAQPEDANIRVYDDTGTLVTTIGRSGEGPGEFGYMLGIGFDRDTLVVATLGRLSRFTTEGEFLEAIVLPDETIRGDGVAFMPTLPSGVSFLGGGGTPASSASTAAPRRIRNRRLSMWP